MIDTIRRHRWLCAAWPLALVLMVGIGIGCSGDESDASDGVSSTDSTDVSDPSELDSTVPTGDEESTAIGGCAALYCEALGRACVEEGDEAECGDCLAGLEEREDRCLTVDGCVHGEPGCEVEVIPLPSPTASVHAALGARDGTTYLGGSFGALDMPDAVYGMVRYGPDGERRSDWPSVSGNVWAFAPDGEGGLYLGGDFDAVDGTQRQNLAHVDASGLLTDWAPAVSGFRGSAFPEVRGTVESIAVLGETIHVSGRFTDVGQGEEEMSQRWLAAFGRDGQRLDWAPDLSTVEDLMLHEDPLGEMLVATGHFTDVDATERRGLAAFDGQGTLMDWAPELTRAGGEPAGAWTATVLEDAVYFAGSFDAVDGEPRHRLAAVDREGRLLDWAPDVDLRSSAMVAHEGVLYVLGRAQSGEGNQPYRVLGLDLEDGSRTGFDVSLGPPPLPFFNMLRALVVTPGGLLVVGQSPESAASSSGMRPTLLGEPPAAAVTRLTWDGEIDDWPLDARGFVGAAARVTGDDVIIGGELVARDQVLRELVVALDPQGGVTEFEVSLPWASVDAMAWSGEAILVGGTEVREGQQRAVMAALDRNGGVLDWSPPVLGTGRVASLASFGDLVAVAFGDREDSDDHESLQVFSSSTAEPAWSVDGRGARTLLATDAHLFVAGEFRTFAGEAREDFAAFDHDGHLLDWSPAFSGEFRRGFPPVSRMAWLGGRLYLEGRFTGIDGEQRPGIAALDGAGRLTSFAADFGWSRAEHLVAGDRYLFVVPSDQNERRRPLAAFDALGNPTGWGPANASIDQLFMVGDNFLARGRFGLPDGGLHNGWALLVPRRASDGGASVEGE